MTRAALLLAAAAVLALAPAAAAQSPGPATAAELPEVAGAANPLDAPTVPAGSFVDTILQRETLWYGVDAGPGQRVGATVLLRGRPDGPASEQAYVEVTITDAQRQPLIVRSEAFTGQADAAVEVASQELPVVASEGLPLIGISLRSDDGSVELEGTGYRLEVAVVVEGVEVAPADTEAPVVEDPSAPPADDVVVTEPPVAEPGPPDVVGDVLPFALVSLAVGGVAGFELSRRRL